MMQVCHIALSKPLSASPLLRKPLQCQEMWYVQRAFKFLLSAASGGETERGAGAVLMAEPGLQSLDLDLGLSRGCTVQSYSFPHALPSPRPCPWAKAPSSPTPAEPSGADPCPVPHHWESRDPRSCPVSQLSHPSCPGLQLAPSGSEQLHLPACLLALLPGSDAPLVPAPQPT